MEDGNMNEKPEQMVKKTENKTSKERQADEHSGFLPQAIQQSSEGIAIADMDGNLIYLNDAFARMHGYFPSELLGKNLSLFHTPEQLPAVEEANRQIKKTGNFRGEIWHVRRDGSMFPGIMHNSLIRDEKGNPIYMLGLLRNITLRKQLEEVLEKSQKALNENRELLDSILNASGVAIGLGQNRKMIWGNESLKKIFGFIKDEDFIGKDTSLVYANEEEYRRIGELIYRITPGEILETEARFKRHDNNHEFIGHLKANILDPSNPEKGAIINIIDITEQKQAEEVLKKSKERYQLLADNITDVILVIDADRFAIRYISPSAESVFGYTPSSGSVYGYTREEVANFNAFDFLTPHSADHVKEVFNREFEKDKLGKAEAQRLELEVLHKDGLTSWMEVSARFIRDDKKQVKSILCVVRDISQRKKAEDKLKKSEKQYRLLAENVTDTICVINLDGFVFNYVSPSVESIFGHTVEEFINLNVYDLLIPDSADHAMKVLAQEIEKNKDGSAEPQQLEMQIIRKDGLKGWVEISARFLRDNKKQVTSVLCVVRDISKRKEVEDVLQKSEDRYRHLVEKMSDGLAVHENELLTFVNSKFCEMLGYQHSEMIGKSILDLLDDHNRQIVKNQLALRKQGNITESYEVELLKKNGSKIITNLSPQGIFDPEGQFKGSFGVFTDITLYKQAEDILNQAKQKLEEKVKQRTSELEEKNVALKVLLDQRDQDKNKLEKTIMSNVKALIEPNITRLKNSKPNSKQKSTIKILESNLNEITAPFLNRLSLTYLKLTPTEIQVANFLKHGATTKEIAESLNLSQRTIDTHRFNIRKKIGIKGKGINLRTYLSSL